jgi:hypothetical protein
MSIAAPPIQVVATGTDWPAIVAAITTGVVGLAGIGGTLWQGKRSREAQAADLKESLDSQAENLKAGINAENERARHADKRNVYASSLAAFNETMSSAVNYRVARQHASNEEELRHMRDRQDDAQTAMFESLQVVMLIATQEVCERAIHLQDGLIAFMKATFEEDSNDAAPSVKDIGQLRDKLLRALRADLGEPV